MRKRKTLLCIALSFIMVVSAIYAAYLKPKQVEASAIVITEGLAIAALLAACGLVYTGVTWWQDGSAAEVWDDDYEDEIGEVGIQLEPLYNDNLAEYIASLGSLYNPDNFNPEEDDPNEKPPKWKQLIEWIKANPMEKIAVAGTALAAVMLGFANDVKDEVDSSDDDFSVLDAPTNTSVDMTDYPYRLYCPFDGNRYFIYYGSQPFTILNVNNALWIQSPEKLYGVLKIDNSISYYNGNNNYISMGGWSRFDTDSIISNFDYENYGEEIYSSNDVLSSGVKYGSIEIDENDDIVALPLPEVYPASLALNWPQLLPALQNALALGVEPAEEVDNIINSIGVAPPILSPDNEVAPELEPLPEIESTDGLNKGSFLLPESITEKFPFCIPFDIVRAFTVFDSTSRAAPRFTLPLKAESYGINYELEIDLSVFDEVAELLRTLELILFIIGLALVSRELISG